VSSASPTIAQALERLRALPGQTKALAAAGAGVLVLLGVIVAAGGGGVDAEKLASSVRAEANTDWELRDDFQEVSDCVSDGDDTYECKVSGDDGEQFIDVVVIDGERFRVDEPEINTFFEGEIR
jgi:hypothetical protein